MMVGEWNEGFYNQIINDIRETIISDCVQLMYEKMREMIYRTVYGQYTPTQYQRRYDSNGGLGDIGTYDFDLDVNSNGFTIKMYTNAEGNSSYSNANLSGQPLDETIVTGVGYSWTESQIYENQPYPRDFYKATLDALIDGGELHYILENKLGEKGINIV